MKMAIEHKSSPLNEAVDTKRNQRHATYVPTEFLRDRLNPQAYRPEILEALSVLKQRFRLTRLADCCAGTIRQGTTPEYGDGSTPCIKVRAIEPVLANRKPEARVTPAFDQSNERSKIGPDTILINRSGEGSVGRASVYLNKALSFVSDDVFACPIDTEHDSGFIAAFLNGWWGKRAIEIGIVGSTGQLKLSQSHVRDLPVPNVETPIARAIGNKVRKAERLRELAEDANASFLRWISIATELEKLGVNEAKFLDHIPSKTCRDKAWVEEIDLADRMDPWPHHVAPRTIRGHLEHLQQTMTFDDIFEVVTENRKRFSPPLAPNCYHISILDVDAGGQIDWGNAAKTRYDGTGIEIRPGDILYPTLNPQETRVAYVSAEESAVIAASPEFSTLCLKEEFSDYPYLTTAVLRSKWVRVQASFLTRSSSLSRRRLAEHDFGKILIPWSPLSLDELEKKLAIASDAYVQAGALVEQAKSNVEALISNTLDLDALQAESAAIEAWLSTNPSPSTSNAKKL